MSNPLTYKGDGVLQEMSSSELTALKKAVLIDFATTNGSGSIYAASGTGNTLIGTFVDTSFQGNVGEGDVTIISSSYNLYQDTSAPSGLDPQRPIYFSNISSSLDAASNNTMNVLADSILSYCVTNEGPGSYQLATSAPSDGDTWVSIGTLSDTYTSGTTSSKQLWKKITAGSYTVSRPIKYAGYGVLQSFTDSEINQISKKVRQRILETGVGSYRFQASTPTPGTWVNKGSITDTRPTTTPADYTATYVGVASEVNYDATVTVNYAGPFDYTGPAEGSYVGDVAAQYAGPVAVDYTATEQTNYTGEEAVNYVLDTETSYTLDTSNNYQLIVTSNYDTILPSSYQGPSETSYDSSVPVSYTLDLFTTYIGPGEANYDGSTTTYYQGVGEQGFTGLVTGPSYYGITPIPVYYVGSVATDYYGTTPDAGAYQSLNVGGIYYGPTGGLEAYTGPLPQDFFGDGPTYLGPGGAIYEGLSGGGAFISPLFFGFGGEPFFSSYYGDSVPVNYQGVNPDGAPFVGTITYSGVVPDGTYYEGPGSSQTAFYGDETYDYYVGPAEQGFTGYSPGPSYDSVVPSPTEYISLVVTYYAGPVPVNFAGPAPATYTGPALAGYDGPTPAYYEGTVDSSYVGPSLSNYDGTVPATYSSDVITYYIGDTSTNYLGPTSSTYTGAIAADYTGPTDVNYTGAIDVNYDGLSPVTYLGPATGSYIGESNYDLLTGSTYAGTPPANYDSAYAGEEIVDSPTDITTITLWRRIA